MNQNAVLNEAKHFVLSCLTIFSPVMNNKIQYLIKFKKRLNLKNPSTLNEKIIWLKFNRYIKDPLVIQCADKFAVREYVKNNGCADILNELIGVYDNAEDIPWDELPEQFALKWNFGAKMNIICTCKSKMNKNAVIKQMKKWGRSKQWLWSSEMQYKYAPKRIICEKLLVSEKSNLAENWVAPEDYKVYCFSGVPTFIMVCVGREIEENPKFYFFDRNWNLARISKDSKEAPKDFSLEKPACFEKLMDCASKLTKPFPFVRADFYVINNQVYFGELTFTPAAGLDSKMLPETDILMGNLVDLNYKA